MVEFDNHATALARTQHGAFSTAQLEGGPGWLSKHRVATARWERHGNQIFVIAGSPDTWEQRLWVALLKAGDGTVIGRRSAARLSNQPQFTGDWIDLVQPESSVTRAKPSSSRRTSRLPDQHITTLKGFPVTTVARTVFDIAGLTSRRRLRHGWSYVSAARVERLLDDALVNGSTSITGLTTVLFDLAGRGRPGTRLMRRLLEERTRDHVATESTLEDLFVKLIDRFGIPNPRRQVVLGDDAGEIGRVDFLFDEARLVIELDGHRFHAQRQVRHNDLQRDLRLSAAGWRSVRLDWWQLVEEPASVAGHISSLISPNLMP